MNTQNNTILITGGASGIGLEIAPEFSKNIPVDKMHPSAVADAIISGVAEDKFEIRIGFADHFYNLNRESPEKAFNALNGVA